MQEQYLTQSDFNLFLEARAKDRVVELIEEIQALEYVKRDRGFFAWEKARYYSLGSILKINEEILLSFDPDYISIQ